MAVLTINREIIEKEGWTLGEFLLMMCAINKIDLESAKRLLVKKDYLTTHCPPEEYPPLGAAPMAKGIKAFNDLVINIDYIIFILKLRIFFRGNYFNVII